MAVKSPLSPVWGQISRQFSVYFQVFHFIPIYIRKRGIPYEHHYRHRPRLLRHQNSALFISGWTYPSNQPRPRTDEVR